MTSRRAKVLEPAEAEAVKRAVHEARPEWRLPPSIHDLSEKPGTIVVHIDGKPFVVASGMSAFPNGHLGIAEKWRVDGYGVVAFTNCEDILDDFGEPRVPGFIHFFRQAMEDRVFFSPVQDGSPLEAVADFFARHEGEFSVFVPTVFVRSEREGGRRWHAKPPEPTFARK
jgi:hypothetical protein